MIPFFFNVSQLAKYRLGDTSELFLRGDEFQPGNESKQEERLELYLKTIVLGVIRTHALIEKSTKALDCKEFRSTALFKLKLEHVSNKGQQFLP